jgi:hypothetical protein
MTIQLGFSGVAHGSWSMPEATEDDDDAPPEDDAEE